MIIHCNVRKYYGRSEGIGTRVNERTFLKFQKDRFK
jgi:hypothetical protein